MLLLLSVIPKKLEVLMFILVSFFFNWLKCLYKTLGATQNISVNRLHTLQLSENLDLESTLPDFIKVNSISEHLSGFSSLPCVLLFFKGILILLLSLRVLKFYQS